MTVNVYLAWTVRAALLLLYFPLQALGVIVHSAHRLDLWASNTVTSSGQSRERLSGHIPESPQFLFTSDRVQPPTAAYSAVDAALAFRLTRQEEQPIHHV
jgi:hypothetical protein